MTSNIQGDCSMSSQADPSNPIATVGQVISLALAGGAGWLNGEVAGQIVSFATILVFGALAIGSKAAEFIDAWLVRRATRPTRIRLQAERLEREAKADQGKPEGSS